MDKIKYKKSRMLLLFLAAVFLSAACGRDRAMEFDAVFDTWEEEKDDSTIVEKTDTDSAKEEEIWVYVCGEVQNPGVYCLKSKDRIVDALNAAGGFTDLADTDGINLARVLLDGEQIYFPAEGETDALSVEKASAECFFLQRVNINTADQALLETLPGIGSTKAADIILYRQKNGSFTNCEEIMNVPGIKAAAYEKIKELITVK